MFVIYNLFSATGRGLVPEGKHSVFQKYMYVKQKRTSPGRILQSTANEIQKALGQ